MHLSLIRTDKHFLGVFFSVSDETQQTGREVRIIFWYEQKPTDLITLFVTIIDFVSKSISESYRHSVIAWNLEMKCNLAEQKNNVTNVLW